MSLPKTIWISRTQPGALETAKRVEAAGYKAVIAPLLEICVPNDMPDLPTKNSVLIFTSKNGVDAFCDFFPDRQFKVITVGTETAMHAREQGFTSVKSAYGTADSVAGIVLKMVSKTIPVVHCAGRHVRGRIVETLIEAGYIARRDLYYLSRPVKALPDIDLTTITDILIYSPLAAETLARLNPDLSHCIIISISQNTDAALQGVRAANRFIAQTPTENAVLACLSA